MSNESEQPLFQIQRVYLKELSLEQPNSPAIFLQPEAPAIEVSLDVGTEELGGAVYEATIGVTVSGKIDGKIAFMLEAKQAGIFEARGIAEAQLGPLLGIGCLSILYPYLRANVADAVTRAGFPPVHLSEINFELFYQQRQQQALKERKILAGLNS
jgi:preprotein translocase subunit SecB